MNTTDMRFVCYRNNSRKPDWEELFKYKCDAFDFVESITQFAGLYIRKVKHMSDVLFFTAYI